MTAKPLYTVQQVYSMTDAELCQRIEEGHKGIGSVSLLLACERELDKRHPRPWHRRS